MTKRLLLAGLTLIVVIALAVLFKDTVRRILVEPVMYLAWLLRLGFESLPQVFLWIALALIGLLVAGTSLIGIVQRPPRAASIERNFADPVETLARWIDHAARGYYFKWRLAQHLSALGLEALAQRRHISVEEARRQLEAGQLDVPPDIRAYLLAGLASDWYSVRPGPRPRLRAAARSSPLDLAPEAIVQFLETQLEAERDHRDR